MNRKTKTITRIVAMILCLAFASAWLAACDTELPSEESSETGETIAVSAKIVLDGKSFDVSYRDCTPPEGQAVVYTRAYLIDGKPSLTVGTDQPGRTAVSVCAEEENGVSEFVIQSVTEDHTRGIVIPYNGFVLSVPTDQLTGLNVRIGKSVGIADTSFIGELERLDKGSFYPDLDQKHSLQKRIMLRDPLDGVTGDGIYFLSTEYTSADVALPTDSVVVTLRSVTSMSYRVVEIARASAAAGGTDQLVFVGAYHCAYAETFLKPELKLTFRDLDSVSSISDCEALIVGETIYRFSADKYNCERITQSGVYLFDDKHSSVATAESDVDRVDVIIVNDIIVYIGEKGRRNMLPLSGGIAVTFAGDSVADAEGLSIGDHVDPLMLDTSLLPENHVKINGIAFAYDKINTVRAPEGVTALYTPGFGATTQTNQYGIEIAVADGKVVSVEKGIGNIEIPENGFVLSIHKDSAYYSSALTEVKAGDSAKLASGNRNYTAVDLSVTAINETRVQDALIVYRNVSSTATNAYGYEIMVDANGMMVGDGYTGNAPVPKGGFVLSGHGVNKEALVSAYRYGGKVYFDEESMRVMLITTPDTMLVDAAVRLDDAKKSLQNAKDQLLYLNYTELDSTVADLESQVGDAQNAFESGDFETALSMIDALDASWGDLQYALLEAHPVENRAMWYRSAEKSDAEVRAVVEKMKSLGINAVYLETWYNGRFIGYSDNDLILHSVPNGEYDALEGFVRICHEYGIEVHAWVENFFIGTVEAQEQANMELASHFEGRWLKDRNGKNTFFYTASNTNFIFMNPFEEEVRTLLIDFYREIITKYDVDGLHLDYIRFPELNYGKDDFGYNENIVSAWQKENNTTVNPATLNGGSLHLSWIKFRQEIINSFVGEIYDMVCDTDPDVWLSAAVYPGVPDIKNDIFQDCANWVTNGYMDELFSMSYGEDNQYVSSNASKFVAISGDKCFYSTGISAFGETTEPNFALQMTEVRKAGSDGVAIFSLANINVSNYQNPIQKGTFRDPSVSVNRLSETVSAQLTYILDKAKKVYMPYAALSESDYDKLCGLLNPLIDDAKSFDLENASIEEKLQYCRTAKASLSDIVNEFDSMISDSKKRKLAKEDLNDLISWLTKSENRLNARLD